MVPTQERKDHRPNDETDSDGDQAPSEEPESDESYEPPEDRSYQHEDDADRTDFA